MGSNGGDMRKLGKGHFLEGLVSYTKESRFLS